MYGTFAVQSGSLFHKSDCTFLYLIIYEVIYIGSFLATRSDRQEDDSSLCFAFDYSGMLFTGARSRE